MRRVFLFAIILIVGIILRSCEKFVYDNNCINCFSFPEPNDEYIYPVKPGDEAWSELITTQLRLDACQIPEDLLETMSTEALVETCVNWPILGELIFSDFASGGAQRAMEIYIEKFNGLGELIERIDRGTFLLNHYLCKEACCFMYDSPQYVAVTDGNFFEVMLSQFIFLETLNIDQTTILVERSLKNLHQKLQYPQEYSLVIGESSSAIVLARSLLIIGETTFLEEIESNYDLSRFIEYGRLPSTITRAREMIDTLKYYAEEYLTEK